MNLFQSENPVEVEVKSYLKHRFGREIRILKTQTLGGGCINHASKLETSEGIFFLKWNAGCPHDMFQREAEGLTELKKAARGQIIIPEVIAVKEVNSTPGFLILEYLEQDYSLSNADEILGRGLAGIHQYTNSHYGFNHDNYCGATPQHNAWEERWAVFFRDNRLGFLLDLIQKKRPLPVEEMKIYSQLLDKIPGLIAEGTHPVLIHGDLWSGNYMLSARGPALIDPAASYADREMEFGIMTLFGGFSRRFFDAYNEVFPLLPDWKERNGLYQLYHVLNHYYLFGGSYRSQALQIARDYL